MPDSQKRPPVFISHASANLAVAKQIEAALDAAGFDPWLDYSDIRVGALLGKTLQQAIRKSQAMVLVWSRPASGSRWVAAEILSAFHMDRYIVPCVVSAVGLPGFLARSVYLDLRKGRQDALSRLGDQVRRAPRARNEFAAVSSYQDPQLSRAISGLIAQQRAVLGSASLAESRRLQGAFDEDMRAAEQRWRHDPTILNLAGYHRKNAYMLKHWDEYCAGRFPPDSLLDQGERCFLQALLGNPLDLSALNGLGNILFFKGEFSAAEFFVERAVACAEAAGRDYPDAEHDLALIRQRVRLQ